jgi:hypothetical protein
MKFLLLIFLPFYLFGEASFISPLEYASQLYKNPRGIGCHNCHGEDGKGKLVARYTHKKIKKEFRGPPINSMDFDKFYKNLNQRKLGMPRYFLTKKEIEALYLYLHQESKK